MAARPPWRDDPALAAALTLGLDRPVDAEAARLAQTLVRAFGPATAALLHYGSHAHAAGPDRARGPDSAWDFFVIVDEYRSAYRALAASAAHRIPARRAAWLNRWLPPNVISVAGEGAPSAKCCVLSVRDLARACAPHPRDHFVRARLFQQIHLAWARDEAAREAAAAAVRSARGRTFDWVRPWLPARFDARGYARTLLEVSYAAEIRPEDPQHVDTLVDAQRATLLPVYDALLAALAARGVLRRVDGDYALARPAGAAARAGSRAWFAWSKARATLRWLKYVALYDDWLDYVVRKVERKSGVHLELTERERRWPLLFLWPKAVRFIGRRRGDQA